MHKKRLLKLADFLETVPRRSFEIRAWVWRGADKPEGKIPGECGFAGCAMGWAAHAKLFRGLKLDGLWGNPIFEGRTDYDAADCLFEIDGVASRVLFGGSSYSGPRRPTPKQVAKRIRTFVETGHV